MKLQKIAAYAGAVAMLFQTAAMPALAATTFLTIKGNGDESENTLEILSLQSTTVVQTNETNVENDIEATATTGGNSIEGTTGGDATILTGSAIVDVSTSTEVNGNVASVETCGCDLDVEVEIKGNGADSENVSGVGLVDATVLIQDNEADIENDVDVKAATGHNFVEDTTDGDVAVVSGDATVNVDILNVANANTAQVGGEGEGGGSVNVLIAHNGVDTENAVELELEQTAVAAQTNETDVDNEVEGDALTGANGVEDTTGGSAGISSGDATADVVIVNEAGFNDLALDTCGCTLDVEATIKQNGADSENTLTGQLSSAIAVEQENTCGGSYGLLDFFFLRWKKKRGDDCFSSSVKLTAKTGFNFIGGSTEGGEGDPLILSGDSFVFSHTTNLGGANYFSN
jgi:hypothetical protein